MPRNKGTTKHESNHSLTSGPEPVVGPSVGAHLVCALLTSVRLENVVVPVAPRMTE